MTKEIACLFRDIFKRSESNSDLYTNMGERSFSTETMLFPDRIVAPFPFWPISKKGNSHFASTFQISISDVGRNVRFSNRTSKSK